MQTKLKNRIRNTKKQSPTTEHKVDLKGRDGQTERKGKHWERDSDRDRDTKIETDRHDVL